MAAGRMVCPEESTLELRHFELRMTGPWERASDGKGITNAKTLE
jgi:hypothetical protein